MDLSIYCSDLFKNKIFPSFQCRLKTAATASHYTASVNMLCDYLKKDFLDIDKEEAQLFFNLLCSGEASKSGRPLSPKSVNIHYARIRALSVFVQENHELYGIDYVSPFLFLTIYEPAPDITQEQILTSEEIDNLLKAAKDLQMYLILSLVLTCGLSVKEITGLKPHQLVLDVENRLSISFLQAAGSKYRYIKVPESLKEPLLLHADSVRAYSSTVFSNSRGTPFSERTLELRVKKVMEDAGLSGWTMRDLRNTAAFYMLSGGASLSQTATQLGICERWMYRFNKVVEEMDVQASDYSMIQIRGRRAE